MRVLRIVAVALLAIAAVVCTVQFWTEARTAAGIDFYQFWVGGQVAGQVDDFYAPATGSRVGEEYLQRARTEEHSPRRVAVAEFRRHLEWYSTPLQYAFFSLASDKYENALLGFQRLSILALVAALALLTRVLDYTLLRALALYDFLLLAFDPLLSDARVVSVNAPVLLALVVVMWATKQRRFVLAGGLLALTVLFKPYVAMAFPVACALFVVERRWRDLRAYLSGALIGCAAGLLISASRFHSLAIWLEWLRALRAMPESIVTADLGNYSLAMLFHVPSLALILTGASFLAVVLAFVWRRAGTDETATGLGTANSLLGAPLVWAHYLLLSVPLLAWLLRPGDRSRNIAGLVALLLIAIVPWSFVCATDGRTEALIVNAGLLIAFAATLFAPRPSIPSSQPEPVPSRKLRRNRRRA